MGSKSIVGSWTYRSFLNIAEHVDDINDLLFADAQLIIDHASSGEIKGLLNMGDSGNLVLKGAIHGEKPVAVRFQGVGLEGPSKGWVYDYTGYVVPDWPHGVDQVQAIVGSVIRSVAHGEKSPAGVVASFICVRRKNIDA